MLLVEDSAADEMLIRRLLNARGDGAFDLTITRSAESAHALLETHDFDVVLSDYRLPGEDGISLLRHTNGLKQKPALILMTSYGSEDLTADAFRAGACDYLSKRRLTAERLFEAILRARDRRMAEQAQEAEEETLRLMAVTDPSTGLYNRRYLAEALRNECSRARRYGRGLSCLMIDIDT